MDNCDRGFELNLFFSEIVSLSHHSEMMREAIEGGGYPLSNLVNSLLNKGCSITRRIVSDYTGESHEFRLNNAGLKMYWRLDRESNQLRVRIGGDQARQFPRFVAAVRRIIEENQYLQ